LKSKKRKEKRGEGKYKSRQIICFSFVFLLQNFCLSVK
jgi:hypothetical protein